MDSLAAISSVLSALDRTFDADRLLLEALKALIAVLPDARFGLACLTDEADAEHARVVHVEGVETGQAASLITNSLPLAATLRSALRSGHGQVLSAEAAGLEAALWMNRSAPELIAFPLVSGAKALGLILVGLGESDPGPASEGSEPTRGWDPEKVTPFSGRGAGTAPRENTDPRERIDGRLLTVIGHQVGSALERARLHLELKLSEERYHDLFHHANDAIYVHDLEMRMVDANEAAIALTGYPRGELEKMSILDVVIPEQRAEVLAITESRVRGRDVRPYEVEIVRKDGSHAVVEVNARLVSLADGRAAGVHGVARDVTERRRLESELRRSREFIDTLVSNAMVAIVAVDRSGAIQIFNRGAESLTGYRADEVVGRKVQDIPLSTTDPAVWTRQLLAKGRAEEQEARVRRKDGVEIPVLAFLSVLRDGEGYTAGAVGVFVDHTEKLRLERELFRAEKLKALGAMAGGVAHDFNNVLSTILGNVQMLVRQDPPPATAHRLRTIEEAALTAAETVKRILDFAGQRTERAFSSADPNRLVLDAVELTRHRWAGPGRPMIRVRTLLARVPAVLANPYEIKEVLMNLIFNAVDAMPEGGTIEIRTERDRGGVAITIGDEGQGIDESIREKVFDPFFTTKGDDNSGLGLSVSYGIVTRHQGSIEVESRTGEGTTFTIRLPAHRDAPPAEPSLPKRVTPDAMRILIIDDEAGIREILSELLAEEGHHVTVAASGPEGVEQFAATPFDLVITDLSMPQMSGLQVAQEVRRLDPGTVCILTSGWPEQRGRDGLDASVADIVLPKPFHLEQVLDSVGRALEIRRTRLAKPDVVH